jgi:hypothetical protein
MISPRLGLSNANLRSLIAEDFILHDMEAAFHGCGIASGASCSDSFVLEKLRP